MNATIWRIPRPLTLSFGLSGALVACGGPDDPIDDAEPPVGEGVFAKGCPEPGQARARTLEGGEDRLWGPAALGDEGDVLMMNEHAAFVIQRADAEPKTYWYYGGHPIDAVAVDGCAQAGAERFEELGFLIGQPLLTRFEHSTLRGFRADAVEIVSDGADGGEVRVRATGADDLFWLIELELVKRAFNAGDPKPMSSDLGLEVQVDYVLSPDSPVLKVEFTVRNLRSERNDAIVGSANFFGNTLDLVYYADSRLDVAGLGLDVGVPWLVATSPDSAVALSKQEAMPAVVSISGVDAFVDLNQFLSGAFLSPAGSPGDTRTDVFWFSVGPGEPHSAVRPLLDVLPNPTTERSQAPAPLQVRTTGPDGAPVPHAQVLFERQNGSGQWRVVDGFRTDGEGAFSGEIPLLSGDAPHRVRAVAPGRHDSEPVPYTGSDEPLVLALGSTGALAVQVTTSDGAEVPAKLRLWDGDRVVHQWYALGEAVEEPVPPGSYTLTVSRGFTWSVFETPVEVAAGTATSVSASIERVVDTAGWMSMDGHVHAGPSPDSAIEVPTRLMTLAAEGVDVAVSADHEAIVPWQPEIDPAGLRGHVATLVGQEVTAPIPEHVNAWPFPDRSDEAPRGIPVDWRHQDIEGVYDVSRARGAQVVSLNHPRLGCSWMCMIGYDRVTGDHDPVDPTQLALPAGAKLWSWKFDAIEVLNGHRDPFVFPSSPRNTGLFDDWISFLNHGHRIVPLGVTDVHGFDGRGSPRTFFRTDGTLADFEASHLVDAVRAGGIQVSTGAFARVSVGGVGPGGDVEVPGGDVELSVQVQALPEIDVQGVSVLANCDEVAWIEATDPDGVVKLDTQVALSLAEDAHLVVLAYGTKPLPRPFPQFDARAVPRVFTHGLFVDVDGDGFTAPGGKTCDYQPPRERLATAAVHASLPVSLPRGPYASERSCGCTTEEEEGHGHPHP